MTTPTQARTLMLVASEYMITPNDRLAGTTGTFDHPEDLDYGAGRSTLFYVTSAEFTRFGTELHGIRSLASAVTRPRWRPSSAATRLSNCSAAASRESVPDMPPTPRC